MIQALLLVASVLGASLYYWRHNQEVSYVQTLNNINPVDLVAPRYDIHPILYNNCHWPILDKFETEIQKYLKKKKRRFATACKTSNVMMDWDRDSSILEVSVNPSSLIRCTATNLNSSDALFQQIEIEFDQPIQIPYQQFVVECQENEKLISRKSYLNPRKSEIWKESVQSTKTSPSIAVLYLKSMSHSQFLREFPKSLETMKEYKFFEYSMLTKMSNNISDVIYRTFNHDKNMDNLLGYAKDRFCKIYNNNLNIANISDFEIFDWMNSLKFDTCSDENNIAERLIDEWKYFVIENRHQCHFSTFYIENSLDSLNLDAALKNTIDAFQLRDVFENTIVVILSAEGVPVGHFDRTYTGKVEERNPVLFVKVPHNLRRIRPDHIFHLEQNQNKLITHLDVFEMLRSFLKISKEQVIIPIDDNEIHSRMENERGISIWQSLIPSNRSCSEAMIPFEFCLCMTQRKDIEAVYNITYEMTSRLYEKMNNDILSSSPCLVETAFRPDHNSTSVFNLNEKVLEGADEYVEFLYFSVQVFANQTGRNKNYFPAVFGQFKHDLRDDFTLTPTSPYLISNTWIGCMAGYLERYCEMCFDTIRTSYV